MKQKIAIILMLFTLCHLTQNAMAQPPRRNNPHAQSDRQSGFDPQKFQQFMVSTITTEAGLTQAETQKFTPIYVEMRDKQRNISHQIHELKTKQYAAEKDYLQALAKIKHLQIEMAILEETYYKQLVKAISAEKMFKIMQAEDNFHRQMVRNGNERSYSDRQRANPMRGSGYRNRQHVRQSQNTRK